MMRSRYRVRDKQLHFEIYLRKDCLDTAKIADPDLPFVPYRELRTTPETCDYGAMRIN